MDFPDPNSEPESPDPPLERELDRGRPSRSRRPERSGGTGGSGGGAKQQLMARRALALGVGLVVLILLVVGAKGCLDARKNRSLEDYSSSVTQVVDETNALSESFFGRLDDPQDLGVPDFVSEIESDRSAMDGFLSRVEKLDTPGDMQAGQDTLILVYQLRAGALNTIAERMPTATGNEGKEQAVRVIAGQLEVLAASDVLYNRVTRHEIDNTIENNGASSPELPRSTFVTDVARWVNPDEVTDALNQVTGDTSGTTTGGPRGTGLDSVSIGGIPLASGSIIAAGTDATVVATVTNQGESDESDIEVSVSVDGGDPITGSIDALAPGETGDASIPLVPAPTGSVTLDVVVAGVDGEAILENNEASFDVTFE